VRAVALRVPTRISPAVVPDCGIDDCRRDIRPGQQVAIYSPGYAGTASRSISGAYIPVRAALFIFARW
jgi:hypothetical protein